MQYTVKQLSELTGLTPRTLRYYDAIGLLSPARDSENDYRLYGAQEVNRLQQILLYREMGLPLEEIRRLLDAPGFDRAGALREHLRRLEEQRQRIETLIRMVSRTLKTTEGGANMSDAEKFEGMKQRVLQENETTYGAEARTRYGDEAVDESRRRVAGMTETEWARMKEEEERYWAALRRAVLSGDPTCEDAREACRLHRAWLLHHWTPEMLTRQSHIGLVEMCGQDERFLAYYEKKRSRRRGVFRQSDPRLLRAGGISAKKA